VAGADVGWAPDEGLAPLRRWQAAYPELFQALRADPRINAECPGRACLHNGLFGTPDAEIYGAMILDLQPRHIVEVGAGFSTRIARAAASRLPGGCRITVIDPEPRTDVAAAADTVVRAPVEDGALEPFLDEEGLLLFIDSSHVLRAGGDVAYLFTSALPRLRAGTAVHVHDVFLPYDYPAEYRARLYTEQYVLQPLLAHHPRYRVLFAAHWMSRERPREMQATFGEAVGRDDRFYGASLWLQVQAPGGSARRAN
jgi:hypothetical protein